MANTKGQFRMILKCDFYSPRVGPPRDHQAPKLPSAQAYKLSSFLIQEARPQAKGSSLVPNLTSSRILEPGYKRTSLSRAQATRI